jgi:hypothetical protein
MIRKYTKLFSVIAIITIFLTNISGCSSPLKEKRNFGEGEVTLIAPAELMIRIIDNKKIKMADFRDGTYTIRLPKGQHSIVFEYIDNWNRKTDMANIMRSPPVVLTYNYNSSHSYILNYKRPESAEEARKLAKRPKFWLEQKGKILKEGVVNKSIFLRNQY